MTVEPKVTAAAVGCAVAQVITGVLDAYVLPSPLPPIVSGGLVTICTFLTGFIKSS